MIYRYILITTTTTTLIGILFTTALPLIMSLQHVNAQNTTGTLAGNNQTFIGNISRKGAQEAVGASSNHSNISSIPLQPSEGIMTTGGMNQNADPPCNSVGHPSCYSKGFADGESAAGLGTSCPSAGHSFGYCEGYNQGSGLTGGYPLQQQQLTR